MFEQGQQAVGCESQVLLAASDAANEHLRPPYRYRLEGRGVRQRLRLVSSNGTHLVLQTEDAFWGSKPTETTLEVAAKEVDCAGLPVAAPSCLWVRELRRAPGPQASDADWHRFYGSIEGYRHRSGTNERVELRHYPLKLRGGWVSSYVLNYAAPWTSPPDERQGSVGGEAPHDSP